MCDKEDGGIEQRGEGKQKSSVVVEREGERERKHEGERKSEEKETKPSEKSKKGETGDDVMPGLGYPQIQDCMQSA